MASPLRLLPARLAAWASLAALLIGIEGCTDAAAEPVLARSSRYGIFRDLVLYARAPARGGAFFLDRFETTRRDWHAFQMAHGRSEALAEGEESLPQIGVDLAAARAYARWRFCRLPRVDEWRHAATGGGDYLFPWGNGPERAWVNSVELGLDRPTPVGTFESGRAPGGAYDLLGNVAEWTESVPQDRFRRSTLRESPIVLPEVRGLVLEASAALRLWRVQGLPLPGPWLRLAGETVDRWSAPPTVEAQPMLPPVWRLHASPALSVWQVPGVPLPGGWLIAAWGDQLPRVVVGGHFGAWVLRIRWNRDGWSQDLLGREWLRFPTERGSTTGLRLAADPEGLLVALLREPLAPAADEAAMVRTFLRRPAHRVLLSAALGRALATVAEPGPLAPLLRDELGR